jgi:hypothetical protein
MDISSTTIADSTQVNADDLIGHDVTVTITDVTKGNAEQPINIHLAEFPDKVFRPSKGMRRVLIEAWGSESSVYVGRRMTLYRDPEVSFGRDRVGGVRISKLSHIDKRMEIPLTVSRGRRKPYVVQPLPDSPDADVAPVASVGKPDQVAPASGVSLKEPTAKQVAACTDKATLTEMWHVSGPERRTQIEARVADLQAKEASE